MPRSRTEVVCYCSNVYRLRFHNQTVVEGHAFFLLYQAGTESELLEHNALRQWRCGCGAKGKPKYLTEEQVYHQWLQHVNRSVA